METIVLSNEKGVAEIILSGELRGLNSPDLLKEIERLIGSGINHIALNFKEVSFVSSAGFGVIIVESKDLRDRDGDITIIALPKRIKDIFDKMGVGKIENISFLQDPTVFYNKYGVT